MNAIKRSFLIAAVAVLGACSWVALNPEAEDVLVLKPYQAKECEQLRRTTSQVLDKVWFVDRSPETMGEELTTLARNTAAEVGGNAIVAESEITEGKQTFIILDCQHLR
ncbi:MAG: DUF4156 domain-containing protein [Pseudomonadota bacterium]|nr:hypothetical protein [Pseudomonadales bacterium]MDY6920272.1 DUF4156 domain-containing protein [Pseudomonadota bacterium]